MTVFTVSMTVLRILPQLDGPQNQVSDWSQIRRRRRKPPSLSESRGGKCPLSDVGGLGGWVGWGVCVCVCVFPMRKGRTSYPIS